MPESKKPDRKKGKQHRFGEQFKALRQQMAGIQQNLERTHQLLGSMSATYSGNDKKLHQHSNDIEDKQVGMADALYAYTDILAGALEEKLGLDVGFLPRLTEEIFVAAANVAQEKRLAAIKAAQEKPKEEGEEGAPGDAPNLEELSEKELVAETDKTGEGKPEYPDGAQFFGE